MNDKTKTLVLTFWTQEALDFFKNWIENVGYDDYWNWILYKNQEGNEKISKYPLYGIVKNGG